MSKLYPVGVQNFEGLIHDGYVYVDKTAQVYEEPSAAFRQESASVDD